MSPITTHILDTSLGRPARGVPIRLDRQNAGAWTEVGSGRTNDDGRIADLMAEGSLTPGVYRMHFDTGAYFNARDEKGFYPFVDVVFEIEATDQHYHVPLLLNPFGYSTYRGS